MGGLSLLQGIFLTKESSQGLLHCRPILYQLSYQGSPMCLCVCMRMRACIDLVCVLFSQFLGSVV